MIYYCNAVQVWNIKTDAPGPVLREGGPDAVEQALVSLLESTFPEPEAVLPTPGSGRMNSVMRRAKPANIGKMSMQVRYRHA